MLGTRWRRVGLRNDRPVSADFDLPPRFAAGGQFQPQKPGVERAFCVNPDLWVIVLSILALWPCW